MLINKIIAALVILCITNACLAHDVIVLIGAPGSGKGTQASMLSNRLGIPHISVGELLRATAKKDSDVGRQLNKYLNSASMVPDSILNQIFLDRLKMHDCANGYILDGAFRSLSEVNITTMQIEQLGHKITSIIYLQVPDDILISRLSGRRICESCGKNYHIINARPKNMNACDLCNAKLIKRTDDSEEIIRTRIRNFHSEVEPIVQYFSNNKMFYTISAKGTPAQIFDNILKTIS